MLLLLRRDRCPVGEEGAALGQVGGVGPAAAAAVVRDRVVEEAPAVVQVLQRGLRWGDAGGGWHGDEGRHCRRNDGPGGHGDDRRRRLHRRMRRRSDGRRRGGQRRRRLKGS